MSTRGLYGIRKNGIDKCTYNHSDSYPDWLGKKVLEFCATNSVERLSRLFDNIEMVTEDATPTEEQIEICKKAGYVNLDVINRSEKDWYCLLRNLQGNFKAYTKCIEDDSRVFMTDGVGFIEDSLFCEYAYIINIDDEVLEYYEGFQKTPQIDNRYGTTPDDNGYYPCKLEFTIPLDEIGFENVDKFVTKMETGLDEEDVKAYQKLIDEYDLSEEDAKAITEDGKADRVCGIYEDTYDVGREYLINVHGIPDFLENYVDFERFGEDEVENTDAWYQLPSGKYAHLS